MAYYYAPDPIQSTQFIPGSNTPANGGQLFFYAAGSSAKQTVYKDNAGAVPWSNPIVLDSGGNLPSGGEVWFTGGQTYKVVFAPSNDTDPPGSPYWTKDNLAGQNDVAAQTGAEWIAGPTPTFVSANSFTLVGDQTATFTKGRRVKTTNTGGTVYSTILNSAFGAVTTVTIVNDSGVLDAGLSAVSYGIIDGANPSIDFFQIGRDGGTVTTNTAGTTDIWGIPGTQLHISNTNAIFSFSTSPYPGAWRSVIVDTSFPLNTSATLSIPGNQNVTTAVGDRFNVIASTAATAIITNYTRNIPPLPISATSGQVYAGPASGTTAAAPSFRNLVGIESAYVLLASKTAASSAALSFTTSDINWTAYDEYEFRLVNLIPTNFASAAAVRARYSSDGGATFISTSAYRSSATGVDSSTTTVNTQSEAANSLTLTQNINNTAGYSFNGVITLYAPNASTFTNKFMRSSIAYYDTNNSFVMQTGGGLLNAASTQVNGFQIFMSAGSVSTGTVYAYGIARS